MAQPAAFPTHGQRPFKSQILRFLSVVGVHDRERFHPASQDDEETFELRKRHISRAQLLLLLSSSDARPKRLKPKTAQTLAERMQIFLDRAFEMHRTEGTLADFELKLGKSHFDFLQMRRGRLGVSADELMRLYVQPPKPAPAPGRRRVTLQIDLVYDQAGLSAEDLNAYLTAKIKDREYQIIAVREACTRIIIEVPASEAEAILLSFADSSEVLSVEEIESPVLRPAVSTPGESDHISELRRLLLREALFGRPWRRLRWLFSPSVRLSPVAHVIRTSEQRAYARPGTIRQYSRALGVDLGMTVVLWPLLGVALLLASMLALAPLYPRLAIGSAIVTGIAMGVAGAQVCSALLSPIACGAGVIPIAWSFGLAHALILGEFENTGPLSAAAIRSDLFTTICGGIVGLAAPAWARVIPAAPVLIALAVCISSTGWLMAQPTKAGDSQPVNRARQTAGALAGSAAGAGIGIVYFLDRALQSLGWMQPWSLIAAFAMAGSVAFTASTGARFRDNWQRPVTVGLIHAALEGLLIWTAFAAAGSTFGLLALSMATAWFHATWFTGAYIAGFRLGGVNGAVAATALEGGVGFTAFVYVRIASG